MTIVDISSIVHALTSIFSDVLPLILAVTAAILTALSSYKKVTAAWPQKKVMG
jgi:hypothetical protein